jgi:hypothetical protein
VQGKRLGTKRARTRLHGARVGNGGTVGMGSVGGLLRSTATATATARAGFGCGCGLGVEGWMFGRTWMVDGGWVGRLHVCKV